MCDNTRMSVKKSNSTKTKKKERAPAKSTGRRYASVAELMRGEGVSQEVQKKVAALEAAGKKPQTIDEFCGKKPGSFKRFTTRKKSTLKTLEQRRKNRVHGRRGGSRPKVSPALAA